MATTKELLDSIKAGVERLAEQEDTDINELLVAIDDTIWDLVEE